jgi:hypothetical protein
MVEEIMRAGLLMAFAAGIVLSGCYETGDTVFPLDGGDALPLKPGVYRCASGDSRDTAAYRVTSTEKNGKYTYTVESKDTDKKETIVLAFYRIAENRYVSVSPRELQDKVVPGQNIVPHHWNGKALETLRVRDERSEELAKKHGVELRGAAYAIGGPIENQRAFIREAAVDPSAEIVQTCEFVSP